MTHQIRSESEDVPARAGQQPQWIAELHARVGRRRRRFVRGGLALAAMAAVVVAAANVRHPGSASTAQPPVSATPPVDTVAPVYSGILRYRTPIELTGSENAAVAQVNVAAGEHVHKGQRLASFERGAVEAQLGLANAQVRDAERLLARLKQLHAAQVATQVEVDRQVGAVEIARANQRIVQQHLKDLDVLAPTDAVVLRVHVQPGQRVIAGTQLFTIADPTQLAIEIEVDEAHQSEFSMGQQREIVCDAVPFTVHGVVVDEQVDREAGTRTFTIDVTVPEGTLPKPCWDVHVR